MLISLQQPKYSRLENKRTGYLLENENESHLCYFLPNKQENPNYIIHPIFQYMAWFWSMFSSLQQPKYSRLENKQAYYLLENENESHVFFT